MGPLEIGRSRGRGARQVWHQWAEVSSLGHPAPWLHSGIPSFHKIMPVPGLSPPLLDQRHRNHRERLASVSSRVAPMPRRCAQA